jgi:hypothetical protein
MTAQPADPSSPQDLAAMLADQFDRALAAYYWALDREEWSALFECALILESIHRLEERLAA